MRHKYLEDIGIDHYPWNNWGIRTRNDKRTFRKQFKKYGFDQRDCYDLDNTLCLWLYEHLVRFKEDSTKQIDWQGSPKVTYNGKDYVVIDLVDIMINNLKEYLLYDDIHEKEFNDLVDNSKTSDEKFVRLTKYNDDKNNLIYEVFDMLKASFSYLWW